MTQYNLNYSGQNVDLAIEKSLAHLNNIDTTPSSPSTKAVTSEGIKAALDGKINTSDIVTNFDSTSNTTVPSSQNVLTYVNAQVALAPKYKCETTNPSTIEGTGNNATLFQTDNHMGGNWTITDTSGGVITDNGSGIFTVSQEGLYCVRWYGDFKDDSSQKHDIRIQGRRESSGSFYTFKLGGLADFERSVTNTYGISSSYAIEWIKIGGAVKVIQTKVSGSGGQLKYRNAELEITKL